MQTSGSDSRLSTVAFRSAKVCQAQLSRSERRQSPSLREGRRSRGGSGVSRKPIQKSNSPKHPNQQELKTTETKRNCTLPAPSYLGHDPPKGRVMSTTQTKDEPGPASQLITKLPETRMKSSTRLLATVAAFLFLATTVASAQSPHRGRITQSFTEPVKKTVAASSESGVIQIAHIKEGDFVKEGDLLATINHNVLKKSLDIAIATAGSTARLDAAISEYDLIKSQLEAINSLVQGGHTNKYEVEQKHAENQRAYAELRAAQDELKLAALEVERIEAQIEDRKIRSKIDGFVTEIHKQPGENVSANEPQYATIVRVDKLKVRFYLDAMTLRKTKPGDQVHILVGDERSQVEAEVTYVSPIIDPDSGLGRLDVRVNNEGYQLQSGTICFWIDKTAPQSASMPDLTPSPMKQR